ncbi:MULTISPECIES: hypothetical protein [unclassified Myroides]|uniref:hypothetical protein n=1 Tax=unclassified Myroides TaxID=2642485 RepID=UPI003D2F8A8F
MAKIRLRAISDRLSSSIRTGTNIFTWSDYDIERYNQLDSVNQRAGKGYRLGVNDVTTDTFPPYIPNAGRKFEALKIVEMNTISIRSFLPGIPIRDLSVGDIIPRDHLERGLIAVSYGGSSGQYETRVGYVDFLWSDDGVNFTEDTRQRFYHMHARNVDYRPSTHATIRFNNQNYFNMYNTERVQYITPDDLRNSLSFEVNNATLTSDSPIVLDFFNTFLNSQIPAKLHIQEITGKNCLKYFGELVEVGMKIPFEGFRQNKVTMDYSLHDPTKPMEMRVYIGEAATGIFREDPLI